MAAQILCDQISTISNMVQGMSNAASKEAILAGNFQSVFTQIGQRHLNTEDGELIVRHVDSAEGNGPKLTSEEKLMWSTKSVGERIKVWPNGCCKCRWKLGCCPSCFK